MRTETEFMDRVHELVEAIHYKDGYVLRFLDDEDDGPYIQVKCWRSDAETGEMEWGYGGRRYLTPDMSNDMIIRAAFALFMAYEEHECREFFKVWGRPVFGPHIPVDALWVAAEHQEHEL